MLSREKSIKTRGFCLFFDAKKAVLGGSTVIFEGFFGIDERQLTTYCVVFQLFRSVVLTLTVITVIF